MPGSFWHSEHALDTFSVKFMPKFQTNDTQAEQAGGLI